MDAGKRVAQINTQNKDSYSEDSLENDDSDINQDTSKNLMTLSQARSTIMDYPEEDSLYNYMQDELSNILAKSHKQASEFFEHSLSKLKEKEKYLIKYYEKKIVQNISQHERSNQEISDSNVNRAGAKDLLIMRFITNVSTSISKRKSKIVANVATGLRHRTLKIKGLRGFQQLLRIAQQKKEDILFDTIEQEFHEKYEATVSSLQNELENLRKENKRLEHEKGNMVNNLKLALERGFDILNSTDGNDSSKQAESLDESKESPQQVLNRTPENRLPHAINFKKGGENKRRSANKEVERKRQINQYKSTRTTKLRKSNDSEELRSPINTREVNLQYTSKVEP